MTTDMTTDINKLNKTDLINFAQKQGIVDQDLSKLTKKEIKDMVTSTATETSTESATVTDMTTKGTTATIGNKTVKVEKVEKATSVNSYPNLGLVVNNETNPVITFTLWGDSNQTKLHKDGMMNVVISASAKPDKNETLVYKVSLETAKQKTYEVFKLSFNHEFKLRFENLESVNTPIGYRYISLNNENIKATTMGQLGMIALSELNNFPVYTELNNKTISLTNTLCILLGTIIDTVESKLQINENYEKSFNSFTMIEKVELVTACSNRVKSYLGENLGRKTVVGALASNLSRQLEAEKAKQLKAS